MRISKSLEWRTKDGGWDWCAYCCISTKRYAAQFLAAGAFLSKAILGPDDQIGNDRGKTLDRYTQRQTIFHVRTEFFLPNRPPKNFPLFLLALLNAPVGGEAAPETGTKAHKDKELKKRSSEEDASASTTKRNDTTHPKALEPISYSWNETNRNKSRETSYRMQLSKRKSAKQDALIFHRLCVTKTDLADHRKKSKIL